jgi:uncharacterized protein
MRLDLQGKTLLITGASSGLGAEFARQFAALGCLLVLVARWQNRLLELQEEISTHCGVTVECVTMDLTDAEAHQQLYDQLKKCWTDGGCACQQGRSRPFRWVLDGALGKIAQNARSRHCSFDALNTPFRVRYMVKRNYGYILLIGSTGSFQSTPTYAAYSAAKSYVLSLGEALHYELRHTAVKCTVLCPGVTRTEFLEVAG